MRVGYGQKEITPLPGEEMTGYGYYLNRRARGALDPLMARAVALDDGARRAVVVQLDLLGLSREFVCRVREACLLKHGLPPECLMLHCTHTHSGPATMELFGCGSPSEHFGHDLFVALVELVGWVLGSVAPVTGAQAFDQPLERPIGFNRVGLPDLDTHLRGVRFGLEGAPPVALVSYACHPVTLGRNDEYSADYPGYLLRELNSYGLRGVFLNGPCGDVDPVSQLTGWGTGTQDTLRIYGRDMAAAVWEGLRGAEELSLGALAAVSRMVPLEAMIPAPAELEEGLAQAEAGLQERPSDAGLRVSRSWHRRMLELHARDATHEAVESEVQVIRCGDLVLVGLGAETFTRLGQVIRAAAPGRQVLLGATSNGVLGYIATREDVEAGGYASHGSTKLYGMAEPRAGAGEAWAAEGARLVEEITAV